MERKGKVKVREGEGGVYGFKVLGEALYTDQSDGQEAAAGWS